MANNYDLILDGVVTRIEALSLSGLDAANVIRCKVARKEQNDKHVTALPCCLVSPFGNITDFARSNLKREVRYPVLVVMVQAGNQDQTTNDDRTLQWSQSIRDEFVNKRLTGVSEVVFGTTVNPRATVDIAAWFEGYDVNGLVFNFGCKE